MSALRALALLPKPAAASHHSAQGLNILGVSLLACKPFPSSTSRVSWLRSHSGETATASIKAGSLESQILCSRSGTFAGSFSVPSRSFSSSGIRMSAPEEVAKSKHYGGYNKRFQHASKVLGCPMKFHVYLPPAAATGKVPVIYWLSGLTCTDENFIQKSGAQKAAAERGIALVAPDTSPRGLNVEGESASWDFGVGAGFYLNATQEKWSNWRMYDYITEELPMLLASHFTMIDTSACSIMGHSMGGHGALTIALKNPGKFKAVSAFAPICNPMECPWGVKAFTGYLGEDKSKWEEYDATLLVKKYRGPKLEILVDQGTADSFYQQKQLLPENFQKACDEVGIPLTLRFQGDYDHSYFFISSFIEDHLSFHAKALQH